VLRYSVAEALHDPFEAVEIYIKELGTWRLECEAIPIKDAYGRVLCEDVRAPISTPPFPRSTVDGFAVIYEDIASSSKEAPSRLRLLGRIHVGSDASSAILSRGACYAVDTGSYLPRYAELVIPYEYTSIEGDQVLIYRPLPRGSNIAYPGSDVYRGFIVAQKGLMLDERVISAIASVGVREVRVYKRVRICIAATGNELQEPGDRLEPGKIYESNLETLKAFLRSEGFDVESLGILRDDLKEISTAMERASKICDLILITGGTSAGVEDHVYRAISENGRIVIRGIKYKPGKPLTLGIAWGKPVIGLPGNPVSVVMLLKTVLARIFSMARGEEDWRRGPQNGRAKILRSVRGSEGRLTHIPSILVRGEKELFVLPWVLESYMISRLALADVFIEIHYNSPRRSLERLEEAEFKSLSPRPREWILEAGDIPWGTGVAGNRLRLYTSREEALFWLDAGAIARAYICEHLDLSEGEAEVKILPEGSIKRYRIEIHMGENLYRIPRYPSDSCYSQAVRDIIANSGVKKYMEIPVESPEQAYEMFSEGYLDLAFKAKAIE
jgi:molybdenum cofactor synthesis domain-containing protein